MRNVELKARLRDHGAAMRVASRLAGGEGPEVLEQTDTYFNVPRGRLKLRQEGARAELIFYMRADRATPRTSEYEIVPVEGGDELKGLLASALGIRSVVRKNRALFMCGNTRIHIDEVGSLGSFLELEVVLAPGGDVGEGEVVARALLAEFSLGEDDVLSGSYGEMIAGAQD
jgi:predicted adenylyl cyclase CyaB